MLELVKSKLEENNIEYDTNEGHLLTYLYPLFDPQGLTEFDPLYIYFSIGIEIYHYENKTDSAYLQICYPKDYNRYSINKENIDDIFCYLLEVIETINTFYKNAYDCNKLIKQSFEL
ncbi:unnamed protein product [Commensalibacter communis]|uniref:Uncharacterized protein n=1 Tax=Commensalibacter communis TaxID=2972786 RepID=A0A9W4TQQ3_9PROT|nr:hypothetical protein [Commensalibacter communis]CAI3957896.1 unnamed protein product [Commensalibacter communis]CAI3960262.1 unnamed protein product [Commensalibacter communis]